jgi:uncharacterized membrane protein HdeD (DUF308 family)
LIIVGIAQLIFALHSQTAGKFFWKVFQSVIYVIAGVGLAFSPIRGVAALTIFLGILLLIYAGVAFAEAFQVLTAENRGWFVADAIVTLLMAVLILARWPSRSAWAIGTLVGVAVLMGGISRTVIASRIRSAVGVNEAVPRKAAQLYPTKQSSSGSCR